ncbi:hypothetical protein GCM10027425_33390 [Alteromonas gracilis]
MDRATQRIDTVTFWASTLVLTLALSLVGWAWIRPSTADEGGEISAQPQWTYASLSQPSRPTQILVPSVGVKAPIIPIQVEDQVLEPPADPSTIGWWDASAMPGQTGGQSVMTGHSVHTGGGELDRLRDVRAGERVDVRTSEGTVRYKIDRKVVWSYAEVAQRYRQLFEQRPEEKGRLVLITCTDWDGTKWNSNVIVFARQLGVPQRLQS